MDLKSYSLSATAARTDLLSGSGAEGARTDEGGNSEREEERKK